MKWEEQYKPAVISIVVPIYNAEAYLERCVESIKKQTYEKWELILVDDGSTDNSLQLCEKLAVEDKRIQVIHMENRGVSRARNLGIEEAKGEYITFIDADDWVIPYMLEMLLNNMVMGVDVVGCGFKICTKLARLPENKSDERVVLKKQDWEKAVLNGDTRCWSKLYRKSYIGQTKFEENLTIGEDMLFLLKLAQKGGCMVSLESKGYCYFENEQGAMKKLFEKSYMDQITCWEEAYRLIEQNENVLIVDAGRQVLIGTIQVIDKLSSCSEKLKKENRKYIQICLRKCKEYKQYKNLLNKKHRKKIDLFMLFPNLFVRVNGVYLQWKGIYFEKR